jgi:hypothetical protein
MTPTAQALLALVAALAVGAWMGRYEVQSNGNTAAIVLDRWTGKTYWCVAHREDGDACALRIY